jgi:protein-L-isoaspartate(D-aspartate) O-methyltransferase
MTKINDVYGMAEAMPVQNRSKSEFFRSLYSRSAMVFSCCHSEPATAAKSLLPPQTFPLAVFFNCPGLQMGWMNRIMKPEELAEQRARMVEEQLRGRGIRDERVLAAMGKVPREAFVAPEFTHEAYADGPLPIGHGQTVSQPYMVAAMVEALEVQPSDRVLEVGTGTGYEAAILGEVAAEVWTIERHAELADRARQILPALGYGNVHVVCGDGSLGLPHHAPFDKIVVAAGAPQAPPSLIAQLAEGGILAVPVGNRAEQQLLVERKIGGQMLSSRHVLCCFVPLVGEEGWQA